MGGPMTREEAWAEFTDHTACWLLHGHGLWTIDAQSTPAAGFVTLGFEYADPEAELGVFLGAEAEGQGLALEALTAARAHVFETLDWPSVVSYVGADNLRALRLMRRLGARRDPQAEAAIGDATLRVFRHHREAA
jgi:RimJ/RimL family protein N-acetyltransferase